MIFDSAIPKTRPYEQLIQTIDYVAWFYFSFISFQFSSCVVPFFSTSLISFGMANLKMALIPLTMCHSREIKSAENHLLSVFFIYFFLSLFAIGMCNATQIHNLFTLWLYHFDALNIATIHFFMCTQMFLFISFHFISMYLCGWLYESHMRNALSAFVAVNFHAICTICAGNAHIRQIIAYLCVSQSVMRVSLLKFLSVFFFA